MFRITISRSRKHPVKDELPLWVLKSRTTLFPKTRKNHLLQEHLFDNAIPFQKKGFTDTKGYRNVPKRNLVSNLQVLLQSKRLKFAGRLPEADILVEELLNFQVKITTHANDIYGAWREGVHDDLVLSVALAAWYATRHKVLHFYHGMV